MTKGLIRGSIFAWICRPVGDMVEEIKSGNGLSFGSEKLRELSKLLPEEGEVLVTVFFVCFIMHPPVHLCLLQFI